MEILIYFCLGCFIASVIFIYKVEKDWEASIGISLMLALFIFVFSGLAGTIIWHMTGHTYTKDVDSYIVSLERGSEIHGSYSGGFFLGSGYVEGTPHYFTYIEVGKNEYKLYSFKTDKCTLVLTDNETPHVISTHTYFKNDRMMRWFKLDPDYYGSTYRIFVPSKTIIREFKG